MKMKITKNPLHWLPIGAAIHYGRRAATDDLTFKTSLGTASIEAEFLDGETGEVLAAAVATRGKIENEEAGVEGEKTSWKKFEAIMEDFANGLACRLANTKKKQEEWVDCAALPKKSVKD